MTNIKNKNNAIEQWLDINNNLKESLSGMASILIIEKILKKYNIDWNCSIKGEDVVIHPEKELSESNKLMNPSIY